MGLHTVIGTKTTNAYNNKPATPGIGFGGSGLTGLDPSAMASGVANERRNGTHNIFSVDLAALANLQSNVVLNNNTKGGPTSVKKKSIINKPAQAHYMDGLKPTETHKATQGKVNINTNHNTVINCSDLPDIAASVSYNPRKR